MRKYFTRLHVSFTFHSDDRLTGCFKGIAVRSDKHIACSTYNYQPAATRLEHLVGGFAEQRQTT